MAYTLERQARWWRLQGREEPFAATCVILVSASASSCKWRVAPILVCAFVGATQTFNIQQAVPVLVSGTDACCVLSSALRHCHAEACTPCDPGPLFPHLCDGDGALAEPLQEVAKVAAPLGIMQLAGWQVGKVVQGGKQVSILGPCRRRRRGGSGARGACHPAALR